VDLAAQLAAALRALRQDLNLSPEADGEAPRHQPTDPEPPGVGESEHDAEDSDIDRHGAAL